MSAFLLYKRGFENLSLQGKWKGEGGANYKEKKADGHEWPKQKRSTLKQLILKIIIQQAAKLLGRKRTNDRGGALKDEFYMRKLANEGTWMNNTQQRTVLAILLKYAASTAIHAIRITSYIYRLHWNLQLWYLLPLIAILQ